MHENSTMSLSKILSKDKKGKILFKEETTTGEGFGLAVTCIISDKAAPCLDITVFSFFSTHAKATE